MSRPLPKDLARCVRFAVLCERHQIPPPDMGQMCQLAQLQAKAYVRTNDHYRADDAQRERDRMMRQLEELAKAHGQAVSWPGIYPMLKDRNGGDWMLP